MMYAGDGEICRFCLKILYHQRFNLIDDTTKQMFEVLLLKPNWDIGKEKVICDVCARKLQNAVDFKSFCLNRKNKILPFINSEEDVKLVLKEEVELNNVSEDQKLCRFCKKMTEKECYTYLQRENMFIVDMVKKYFPELHSRVTEELITCQTCLDTLQSVLNFIMDLLDVEEKIKENVDKRSYFKLNDVPDLTMKYEIDCSNNIVKMEEECDQNDGIITVKHEINGNHMGVDNQQFIIKNEAIEIKSEENDDESFQRTSEVILKNGREYGYKCENIPTSHIYKCKMCIYESKHKLDLERHTQTHESNSEIMYKREMCLYKAKDKSNVDPDMLTHQDPLAINMFKCDICSHETNRKGNLKLHMLIHQDLRQYKCESCSYETDQKGSLKQHMITHKSPSEIKIFKCERCSFGSRHLSSLERHILIHQNPSELTMYKCEICPFQSKHESSLVRHVRTHQSPSNLQMYKCVNCSYEAPQKDRLRRHMLIHQKPSEITMYKCDKCSFEAKRNDKLKQHMLTHQDLSEVTVYKCEKCSYKAKRKDHIKQHMVTHQNLCRNEIYMCDSCPYKSKYRRCLDKHRLGHQNS